MIKIIKRARMWWCGGNHFQTQCHFKNAKCHNCGIVEYISWKCLRSTENDLENIKLLPFVSEGNSCEQKWNNLWFISYFWQLLIKRHFTLLNMDKGKWKWHTGEKNKRYSGETITALGKALMPVCHESQHLTLNLLHPYLKGATKL